MKIKSFKDFDFKTFFLRLLLITFFLVISFVPIFFIFRAVDSNLWDALCSGNQQLIVQEVDKYDNQYGIIIIAILQIVQNVVIIIPSAPIHIAAGILLGTWKGFLTCHIADVISNFIIFVVYSRIKKQVDKIIPIDRASKTVRMIEDGRSPSYMVVMVCLLPAVPNGFIPYAAVNAKMKLGSYIAAITIGAAIPTLVLTAVGERIFNGDWLLFVILVAISFIGVFLLVKYQHKIFDLFDRVKGRFTKKKKAEEIADVSESSEEEQ